MLAGAINSVAGGGSFVSFPTLLFVGHPAGERQCHQYSCALAGSTGQRLGLSPRISQPARRVLVPLTVTGIIGGLLGAYVLLITPPATFMILVPWLLLIATLIFMMSGRITRWVRQRAEHGEHHEFSTGRGIFLQMFIAFYLGILRRRWRHSAPCHAGAAGHGPHPYHERAQGMADDGVQRRGHDSVRSVAARRVLAARRYS